MQNYYDFLKISPSLSAAEIEKRIDEEYNHWRRLITHHDPEVVDQANTVLQQLERIRPILADAIARQKYDASLGLQGSIGGLADPNVPVSHAPAHMPSSPSGFNQPVSLDAWLCKKCSTSNRIGLKFCANCGGQVGRECPKCDKMIASANVFCSHCGVNINNFVREKEIEKAALQRKRAVEQRQREERTARKKAQEASRERLKLVFKSIFSIAVIMIRLM